MAAKKTQGSEGRLLGAILGGALGDACGLPGPKSVDSKSTSIDSKTVFFPHTQAARGFPLNDVTDKTDHVVLVMRTLTTYRRGGIVDPAVDFAGRLVRWLQNGFPELGDAAGHGRCPLVRRVAELEGFAKDPFGAAGRAGDSANHRDGAAADGGGLVRAPPCAFMPEPATWAEFMCRVTHADVRCAAASIALALLTRAMADWADDAPFPLAAVKQALGAGLDRLGDAEHRAEFLAWVRASQTLAGLGLAAKKDADFVYRAFACGFWAVRQLHEMASASTRDAMGSNTPTRDAALFERLVSQVVAEGGEADMNGAIVGAVVGAAVGHERLPKAWLESLLHGRFLEQEASVYLASLRK